MGTCYTRKSSWMLALLLVVSVVLGGCGAQVEQEQTPQVNLQFPPLQSSVRAALYFQDADGHLIAETREMDVPEGLSAEYVILERLIAGPEGTALPVAPRGTELNSVLIVQNVAYVDVSFHQEVETEEILTLRRACGQTLKAFADVQYIVLTQDDAIPPGVNGMEWIDNTLEEHTVALLLYYPNQNSRYAVPTPKVVPEKQNIVETIFAGLGTPTGMDTLYNPFASGIRLSSFIQEGERISLYLQLETGVALSAVDYAALALSMLYNVPTAKQVWIYADGQLPEQMDGMNLERYYTMESVQRVQGATVQLYFAPQQGDGLIMGERTIPWENAGSLLAPVQETLRGLLEEDPTDYKAVVPEEVDASLILSYVRDGDLIALNFSDDFYTACQDLTEQEERQLVYAIVNAVTQRADIRQVLFLNEGKNVDSISGHIILRKALIANPGLVQSP